MDSIIFDVDGTLWDSTESVAQSWTAYLREKEHMDITLKQNSFALLMDAARPNMKLS